MGFPSSQHSKCANLTNPTDHRTRPHRGDGTSDCRSHLLTALRVTTARPKGHSEKGRVFCLCFCQKHQKSWLFIMNKSVQFGVQQSVIGGVVATAQRRFEHVFNHDAQMPASDFFVVGLFGLARIFITKFIVFFA